MNQHEYIERFLSTIGKHGAYRHGYSVRCDGIEICQIDLPDMEQGQRDIVRKYIANDYDIPVHYLIMHRRPVSGFVKPGELRPIRKTA